MDIFMNILFFFSFSVRSQISANSRMSRQWNALCCIYEPAHFQVKSDLSKHALSYTLFVCGEQQFLYGFSLPCTASQTHNRSSTSITGCMLSTDGHQSPFSRLWQQCLQKNWGDFPYGLYYIPKHHLWVLVNICWAGEEASGYGLPMGHPLPPTWHGGSARRTCHNPPNKLIFKYETSIDFHEESLQE